MTTPEFQDWAQPVGILDVSNRLTAVGTNITAGASLGPFTTNQLASLIIRLTLPAGAGTDQFLLILDWQEPGGSVSQEYLTYHDASAYGGAYSLLLWQVPVRGSSVFVRAQGTNGNNQAIVVTGSTRAVQNATVRPIPSGSGGGIGAQTGRFLLDTGGIAVPAAGTSARFYIPPVAGRIAVRLNQSVSTLMVQLDSVYYFAGSMARQPFQYLAPTGGAQLAVQLDCPGMGLELTMFNGDAGAHTMHAYVWDVS